MSHLAWQLLGYGLVGLFALVVIADLPRPRSKPRLPKAARPRKRMEGRDH